MGISTLSVRMLFEPIRTLAFGSISGTYMGIGTPLIHPSRLLLIQNLTDSQMDFSIDGIDTNFTLPANSNFVHDVTTNQAQSAGIYFGAGTRFYVKEVTPPSLGAVYITTSYGSNN